MSGRIGLGKVALLLVIATAFLYGHQAACLDLDMDQNIYGYMNRAESATTAGAMAEFIGLGLEGLENRGLTKGNWSWIGTNNPETQMEISILQLEDLKDRLIAIEENENISSMDYAMSLSEIKGSFEEISFSPYQLYAKKYSKLLYMEVWLTLMIVLIVGGAFGSLFIWDKYLIRASWICRVKGHRWYETTTYDDDTNKNRKIRQCGRCDKEEELPKKK